jgi:hypothetical protein
VDRRSARRCGLAGLGLLLTGGILLAATGLTQLPPPGPLALMAAGAVGLLIAGAQPQSSPFRVGLVVLGVSSLTWIGGFILGDAGVDDDACDDHGDSEEVLEIASCAVTPPGYVIGVLAFLVAVGSAILLTIQGMVWLHRRDQTLRT